MKNSKFGKSWILYKYTVGPQCKIFNYGLQEQLMGAKWICILIGINETKWTTFDFMRNDVLQNYLDHIFVMFGFIILTTWNFKMQAKLQFIRPPNSYILHCHSKSGLFTIYLRGNDMKNSKLGKSWILYMYTLRPKCNIFNYGLQRGTHGCQMTAFW